LEDERADERPVAQTRAVVVMDKRKDVTAYTNLKYGLYHTLIVKEKGLMILLFTVLW
jgi:hypothetical protein